MITNTFQEEGAANALVDEASSLTGLIRHIVVQSRAVTTAYQRVNRAIETAILEIDIGQASNDDAMALHGHEREA